MTGTVKDKQRKRAQSRLDAISHDLGLLEALKFKNERAHIINEDPASRKFLIWFIVSCYFPVITACMGPVANTISIACLVDHWGQRIVNETKYEGLPHYKFTKEPRGIYAVNAVSLVLGFLSNIILFCHFTGKLGYVKSQLINIIGWTTAGVLLLIDVIVYNYIYLPDGYQKSIGFWYAVITSALYLLCTVVLLCHFTGYLLGKYPPAFNLLPKERSIMVFTIIFSVWLIWGAVAFSNLLHISYGNALYYCTVSLLTVGLGDIIPINDGTKALSLIFSMSGVLILGLIVFMTRSIIQQSSGPIFFYYRVESMRVKIYRKVVAGTLVLSEKESFDTMMKLRRKASFRAKIYSLLSTVSVFALFWLVGALVFKYSEIWGYFDSAYFCFLCLLTIGYGDFVPASGAGRAFFVIWSLGAVPLMGAILSTVGDQLNGLSDKLDIGLRPFFGERIDSIYAKGYGELHTLWKTQDADFKEDVEDYNLGTQDNVNDRIILTDSHVDNTRPQVISGASLDNNINTAPNTQQNRLVDSNRLSGYTERSLATKASDEDLTRLDTLGLRLTLSSDSFSDSLELQQLKRIKMMLRAVRKLHLISLNDSEFNLSDDQWFKIYRLYLSVQNIGEPDPNFWLSDKTPLKFPINQPHFAFARLFNNIETLIKNLVDKEAEFQKLDRSKGFEQSSTSEIDG